MRVSFLGMLLVAFALRAGPAAAQQEMIFSTSKLVASLLPSVVNIAALEPPKSGHNEATTTAGFALATEPRLLGSGFVISRDGTIVTNYHVVAGAVQIIVTFSDGEQAAATIRAADRLADIALLQIHTGRKLAVVRWAPPHSLQVGDPVIAVGNPLGVGMSVTSGIVSAVNRNIMETPYDNYIQTDAPINHGNSGGPLFNLKGEVVGIDQALISPTRASAGLGFAIPAEDALFVIGRLETYGWVKPGWLGIKVQRVTPEIADALGLASTQGAIVAYVIPDGPAEKGGLRAGDVIVDYREHPLSDERALLRAIAETPEGTRITVRVLRGGEALTLFPVVGQYPRQQWEKIDEPVQQKQIKIAVPADLGLKLAPLAQADRLRLHMSQTTPALLIAAVEPGTDADWRGVKAGEAIERVDEQPVGSPQAFRAAIDSARNRGRLYVAVLVDQLHPLHPGPEWMALKLHS